MKVTQAALLLFMATVGIVVVSAPLQTPLPQKSSFELYSLKPNQPGPRGSRGINARGDRLDGTSVTLRTMLQFAYHSRDTVLMRSQVIGLPGWADTDHFDVQAKLGGDASTIGQEQIQLMMQTLLEERFALKVHREMREMPVYELAVASSEPKIKLSADQTPPDPNTPPAPSDPSMPPPRGTTRQIGRGLPGGAVSLTISGSALPLSTLIALLQSYAGRVIVDKTNLSRLYDFKVEFTLETGQPSTTSAVAAATPSAALDLSGPSLFDAVQEQLGLRLVSTRGSVEVLVIDSVQKPTVN